MQKTINYNGRNYRKHSKQKYYYVSRKGNNYSCCLHRQIWFDAHGEIPEGYQVHHKNGDAFDNRIENFELVERRKHIRDHMIKRAKENPEYFIEFQRKGQIKAAEWHRSKEGIEWHKENAKKCNFGSQTYGNAECNYCKTEYLKKNTTAKFCSNKCKSAWRRLYNPDYTKKICPICNSEFTTLKYLPKKYCSQKCKPAPNPFGMAGKPKQ